VYIRGQQENILYLDEKYFFELENFSANAKNIWDSSKTGDVYYVYNNNTGNIDNIYIVTGTPGEVYPGTDEEAILEDSRYFRLVNDYVTSNPLGRTLCFFNNSMELKSA